MVIQSSEVAMASYYQKSAYSAETVRGTSWGNLGLFQTGETATTLPQAMEGVQVKEAGVEQGSEYNLLYAMGTAQTVDSLFAETGVKMPSGELQIEFDSLKNLMQVMFGEAGMTARGLSPMLLFDRLMERYRERLQMILARGLQGGMSAIGFGTEVMISDFSMESETSAFYSKGTVKTGDGRSISFDLEAIMSRSFVSYSDVSINYREVNLMDPLVINLGGGTAEVSDQKFLFDIDADGELDNISLLGEMCGFLALDKNGDGVVNDGSELFGTKSGDGFSELAVFDLDGNGWIDENDEVFNRLRIWKRDENGNNTLVGLGVAGVGAIYLGNIATQFSLNSAETNETNGQIRKTGVFLTEAGEAGTIQHVDLAVEGKDEINS